MNAEHTKITNTISVFDNAVLNARFEYEIDLVKNRVSYAIACYWKVKTRNSPNGIFGKCPFGKFADASLFFDGIMKYAETEANREAAA